MPLLRSRMLVTLKTAMIPVTLGLWATACAGMGGPRAERHEPLSAVAPSELADQVAAREAQAGLVAHSRQLRHARRRLRVVAEMTLAREQPLSAEVRALVRRAPRENASRP